MRELQLDEIGAIAGGQPPVVALEESLYRVPAEPLRDPIAPARHSSEPVASAPA